jgi:hypothetical protein
MAPEITVVSKPKRRLPGAANNGVLNEIQIAGYAALLRTRETKSSLSIQLARYCQSFMFVCTRIVSFLIECILAGTPPFAERIANSE